MSDNSAFEQSMPITIQFEESHDRDTPGEARGGSRGTARPQIRAVPVSQPVKANESQRFQKFVASVKEGLIADQNAERIVREEEEARLALEVGEDTEDEGEVFPETSVAENEEQVALILLELSDLITSCKPSSRLVREAPSTLVASQPRRVLSDSNAPESVPEVNDSGKRVLRPRGKQPERRLELPKPAFTARKPPKTSSIAVTKSALMVPVPAPTSSSSKSPTDPVVAVKSNKRKPNMSACYNKFRATIVELLGKEALVAFRKTNVNSTAGYLWRQMSQEEQVTFAEQTEEEQRALLERVMRPDEGRAEETQQAEGRSTGEVTE